MCHVYNSINKELPVNVHGYVVLEVLLDPGVQSLPCYIIKYHVLVVLAYFELTLFTMRCLKKAEQ